ncbi:MAG: patatin-like phospholipase family protein [Planctomycetia bacterium]|nr:patatin-like phospholipase family protein [Planctomycetia bacterium]
MGDATTVKPIGKATLALGGGGARGIAHLGAIEEVLSAGYGVERIVGVSIGALVGALYAFRPEIRLVQKLAGDFLQSPEFQRHQKHLFGTRFRDSAPTTGTIVTRYRRLADALRANRMLYRAVRRTSLIPGELLDQVVNHLLPDADIRDAAIPLCIVAVDLHTGRPVVLDKGPVRVAARASASVPGIFPPVAHEQHLLVDIGGFAALPLGVARTFSPELLFAVDVGTSLRPIARAPSAVETLLRMNDIGAALFRAHVPEKADLVILPEVGRVDWFDFTSPETMIAAGRTAARTALAEFTPPQNWLQRLFGHRASFHLGSGPAESTRYD